MSDLTDKIRNYHAHIYFSGDDETRRARAFREQIRVTFGDAVIVGRFHEKPVGPHPRGSCLITINVGDFERVLSWLSLHRDELTVFCHLNTGNDLQDHTDLVIWLGESEPLHLDVFSG